jgi:metal-responsive CopG/Arc/MetJ family transcriptional regulator
MEWMAKEKKSRRRSVSLPARMARNVDAIARSRKTSANRVLVDLIEAGLQSKQAEKERFFALANRLSETSDPSERQRIKKELARTTFGE